MDKKGDNPESILEISENNIYIFGQINMAMAAKFTMNLKDMSGSTIYINFNSSGGQFAAGLSMYNAMKERAARNTKFTTINLAVVGSAATIPFQAGDLRRCHRHSMYLMHPIRNNLHGHVSDQHLDAMNKNNKMRQDILCNIFSSRKLPIHKFFEQLSNEEYMTAEQALELGLCDEII